MPDRAQDTEAIRAAKRLSDEEIVRMALRWPPGEHHNGCDVHTGGECDCYGLRTNEAHSALGRLVARLEAAERERDGALERVRVRHGDVRKSSERAEQAYRERDVARAREQHLVRALERLATKAEAYKGGYNPLGAFQLHAAIRHARAALAAAAPGETEQTP